MKGKKKEKEKRKKKKKKGNKKENTQPRVNHKKHIQGEVLKSGPTFRS